MYLSTKQFYHQHLAHLPVELIYPTFDLLEKLVATQGIQKLKKCRSAYGTPYELRGREMLTAIKKVSPEIPSLIQTLIAAKKFNKKEIKILTSMMRKQVDDNGIYFRITAPDPTTEKTITSTLEKEYASPVIEYVTSSQIGVKVEGEGLAYQRNLEQDLQNIFKNLSLSLQTKHD